MSILQKLNILSSINSTNEKLKYLKLNSEDKILKEVFRLAYTKQIKFWIKIRPIIENSGSLSAIKLEDALSGLELNIATRTITGNEAINFIKNLAEKLDVGDREVFFRVIERDLKCGVNISSVNKTWGSLIPEYPVLLCGKFNEKTEKNIKYPAIFQCKMDSSRINLEFDNGKFVSATTRNGNILDITCFDDIEILTKERCILDGELMWRHPDGTLAERKVSNGYVTKAVRGTITKEEAEGLYAVIWDYIPYDDFLHGYCNVGYQKRFEFVGLVIPTISTKLQIVESEIVNSREEVMQKYQRNLERGEEGGILKAIDGIWESKRSKYQLKLKAEDPADLLVVGFEYGNPGTQFEGMLGSLICETSCGKLRVNVGSGFKHKKGERDNPESYIGKIIQVKYNCVISSRNSDIKSLFLPIYDGIRDDKTVANTLEELE